MKCMGIYLIKHIPTERVYVGSSVNVRARLLWHKRELVRNKHHNDRLQRSWNFHGADEFDFSLHCIVDGEDQLFPAEQYFMDLYGSINTGFNMQTAAFYGDRCRFTDEVRAKLSASRTGVPRSQETCHKIAEAHKGNTHFLGKKHSEQTKQQISTSKKGIKFSDEHKAKLRGSHHQTDIQKQKMSETYKGRTWSDARRAAHEAKKSVL